MTDRETMKMALEALQCSLPFHETVQRLGAHNKAITALRAQLEQPEQEPVAWMDRDGDLYRMPVIENWSPPHTLLYTTPPQRKPFTDEQLDDMAVVARRGNLHDLRIAIEAAHGIGEKP